MGNYAEKRKVRMGKRWKVRNWKKKRQEGERKNEKRNNHCTM